MTLFSPIVDDLPDEFRQPSPALSAQSVVCDGDGVSGKRVQAVYVRGDQSPDRYAQLVGQFQTFADQIDTTFVEAASRLGGGVRHVRFVTQPDCRAKVDNVVVPQSAMSSPSAVADQLAARGYNRTDRKYLFWHDSGGCGVAWGAPGDDRPGADNGYNSGPSYAAVGTGCWTWQASAHELLHTLGAVQRSAPNSTAFGHCWDDEDIMCYDDGGIPNPPGGLVKVCPGAPENQIDCGGNDYFHTNPAAGSYLATHWNVARSQFLTSSGSGTILGIGGKCVDVSNSGTADGTVIQLWGCNGTAAQQWSRVGDTLRALGKCMDVNGSGTADGTVVHLWTCNNTGAQVWSRVGNTLRNPQSGKCLDAASGSSADGTRLRLWTCTGAANQNWQL
ncbi:ricin-type beta-trefoil lectin domain protein [Lentzea sp. NPDC003310]|uniref:ricin-type beta-trefoil lectin domain protein n=1 Tax=Lentzea sp. NPDC003310 TaxID=3154447 RepID=UPI0033A75B48